jgi:hypothetical protein
MKDRTLWLDALKTSVEKKSTETHKSATRASARPVNAFSEVLTQHTDKTDRSSANHEGPLARAALLELFQKDRDWQTFFKSCCETSTYRLVAQAWQFREELAGRDHRFPTVEVEDALLVLARQLLPESPAAGWDADWANQLCKDALAHLAEHYAGLSADEKDALDLSAQDAWDEGMVAAGLGNDPATFRAALKGWERAGLEAIEWMRVKGGVA